MAESSCDLERPGHHRPSTTSVWTRPVSAGFQTRAELLRNVTVSPIQADDVVWQDLTRIPLFCRPEAAVPAQRFCWAKPATRRIVYPLPQKGARNLKPNYQYEKRQRELEKKKKKAEKENKKAATTGTPPAPEPALPQDKA